MKPRTLTDKHLRISTELLGARLASPMRRAVALGIDLAILLLPSLAVAVGVALLSLSFSDPEALTGMRALLRGRMLDESGRHGALKKVLPLLARIEAPGMPYTAHAAIEEGKLDEAVEIIRDYDFQIVLQFEEFQPTPLKPKTIRIEIGALIPRYVRFLALYGVAAAYFTLLSAGKGRATLGKLLVGIRTVRLDGHPLSALEGLERFVGYLHIPATLGLSLLDLWRDPNRRLPHDRVVHTVVLRVTRK